MDDFANFSGKYWQVLDEVENRFRLRWKGYWSEELWATLKDLKEAGQTKSGIALLPNTSPNLKLYDYMAFNALLVRSSDDDGTGEGTAEKQFGKKALSLSYVWDANGVSFHFIVFTENGKVDAVFVNDDAKLDVLAQYELTLANQLNYSMKQLMP